MVGGARGPGGGRRPAGPPSLAGLAGEPVTICDGRYHSAVVPVGRYPNKAQLSRGQAWIQFCLVAPDPSRHSELGIVASQSEWAPVVGISRHAPCAPPERGCGA